VKETGLRNNAHGADKFGLKDLAAVRWNLPPEQLYEFAVAGNEGHVVEGGAFCAETGIHTGRSATVRRLRRSPPKRRSGKKNGKSARAQFDVPLGDFLSTGASSFSRRIFMAGPIRIHPARAQRFTLIRYLPSARPDPAFPQGTAGVRPRLTIFACRPSRPIRSAMACAPRR
jgi:hypothetical protein